MVNTVKFSDFAAITKNGTNSLVGISNGVNAISDLPINWTTGTRPVTPTNGLSGYNTTLSQWEFWNGNTSVWEQFASGGAGTVTEVDTGTGLTGGPITSSGTISFASIAAASFWANTTGGAAVPTVTALSTLLLSANNLSDLPNKATARTNLGVAIGTNVEAWSAILDQIAANTWLGSTSLTTLGTITTGVWHGSPVGVAFGGTGNTTFTAYSVICAGTTATGTFQNVSGLGTAGQVLTSAGAGGLPTWQNTTGSGTVNAGLINQLAYYAANGTAVSGLATSASGTLITSAGGVPSISQTLPSAVQTNITALGTILTGVWDATPIALAFGGTNAALTASLGGIFYSTATAGAILSGTATANQVLLSGSSAAPAWSTATYPATTSINRILYSSAANTISEIASSASGVLITSAGSVPSISQTLPSAVQGNITVLGTIVTGVWNGTAVTVPFGGTGNTTFTAYAVLCAGTTATGAFQNVTGVGSVGQILTSNGAGTLPTWQNVSGTGTVNSGSQNQLTYYAAAGTTVSGLATANNGVLVTSATGAPSILAGSGATGTILQANAAAAPSWSTATYPSVSGTAGKFLVSDGTNIVSSTSTIPTSAGATANKVLLSDGTNYVLSTPTFPNASATTRKIIVSDGTNWVASTETYAVPGTSGNVLTSDGTNWTSAPPASTSLLTTKGDLFGFSTVDARVPVASGNGKVLQVDSTTTVGLSYSTPTYPSASGTSGQIIISNGTNNVYSTPTYPNSASSTGSILRADGTNWLASTSTYPNTNAINTLLYASSANVMAALATANSGVLVTSSTGIPSILAAGTTGQVLQASSAGTPAWSTPTYPTGSGSAGVLLRSDGTNYVATTSTYPNTNAINTLLYASSANVMAALATVNSAYLTTDSGGIPTWNTTLPIKVIASQIISATGAYTYTRTANCVYAMFELQGGGGGAGGTASGAGTASCAGSGGAGAYMKVLVAGGTNLASVTGSVGVGGSAGSSGSGNAGGNGGNTTLIVNGGSTWTASGGIGGTGSAAASAAAGLSAAPGAGGTVTTGTNGTLQVSISGQPGNYGFFTATAGAATMGGSGGNAQLGRGGVVGAQAPANFGGGAGSQANNTASNAAGFAGAQGVVLVTEFCTA